MHFTTCTNSNLPRRWTRIKCPILDRCTMKGSKKCEWLRLNPDAGCKDDRWRDQGFNPGPTHTRPWKLLFPLLRNRHLSNPHRSTREKKEAHWTLLMWFSLHPMESWITSIRLFNQATKGMKHDTKMGHLGNWNRGHQETKSKRNRWTWTNASNWSWWSSDRPCRRTTDQFQNNQLAKINF